MKTAGIVPAQVLRDADGVPFAPAFGDVYHPRHGALAQARHVFLAGNGLPQRWAGRTRFVVLETGFGLGNNFLATWDAWRRDPQRSERLVFVSIEQHPPTREALAELHRGSPLADLADALVGSWPASTWNLHRRLFESGRVELLLCFGDAAQWLPELVAPVDAFYLDGFAPACNPQMWTARLFKSIARLAAPGATAATWSAARVVRDGLAAAGFEVVRAEGSGGKRDITTARFAPRHVAAPPPGRVVPAATSTRHAVIVGGGVAGCSIAGALAVHGWDSTVLDRHAQPAQEASGNPGGLFHGVVHPQDGLHARFHRAAALAAQTGVRDAIARHGVPGEVLGLLRLQTDGDDADAMRGRLAQLGLPATYVQALDAPQASDLAGIVLPGPAWFYPGGGWARPGALAAAALADGGGRVHWRGGSAVERLEPTGTGWRLRDRHGGTIAEAATVVLANAGDALRLLGPRFAAWLTPVGGQIGRLPAAMLQAQGRRLPRVPIAGAGYVLPPHDGQVVFGATTRRGDAASDLRAADHAANLAQLGRLLGAAVSDGAGWSRAGVRWSADDRLPFIGPVPDPAAAPAAPRIEQPRFVPRCPGLYLFTGLGSRGIVSSMLGAPVLAAWIAGAPVPLEAGLLDAIDPARVVSRNARRAAG